MNRSTVATRYSSLSILLHWFTLLLMVAIYLSIELHSALPRGNPLRHPMEEWHIYFGLCLLPIVIFRAIVILCTQIPAISPQPPLWQTRVTKAMKGYLYLLMIGAPLLGWLMENAGGHAVSFFGLLTLPTLVPASEGMADFLGEAHEILGVSGYFFIAIHAFAALYHHYLLKDNTLLRMLPAFVRKG